MADRPKHIVFTVTNDLTFDQRMNRICTTLAGNGYRVTLVGRKRKHSTPLRNEKFRQKRLSCWFERGKLFYAEYNVRLFFFLLFKKMDALCAIDLDTILPCLYVSKLKGVPRIYDAHELFTGLKEVATRPKILSFWLGVERKAVPQFPLGYTVSQGIVDEFFRRYGVRYQLVRNITRLAPITEKQSPEKFLLYQGAVNEARAFENIIPAVALMNCPLVICGDGNFMEQLKQLIADNQVDSRVILKGMVVPEELSKITQTAWIGIGLTDEAGINQYLALPNKFFDYIHAGIPQVAVDFPEYRKINEQFEVAILLKEISPERIAEAVNKLLEDDVLYQRLRQNCLTARQVLNWQQEEKKLLEFYQTVFSR